jgi:hypothetical protein
MWETMTLSIDRNKVVSGCILNTSYLGSCLKADTTAEIHDGVAEERQTALPYHECQSFKCQTEQAYGCSECMRLQ